MYYKVSMKNCIMSAAAIIQPDRTQPVLPRRCILHRVHRLCRQGCSALCGVWTVDIYSRAKRLLRDECQWVTASPKGKLCISGPDASFINRSRLSGNRLVLDFTLMRFCRLKPRSQLAVETGKHNPISASLQACG